MRNNFTLFILLFISIFSYPVFFYNGEEITIFDIYISLIMFFMFFKFILTGRVRFFSNTKFLTCFFIFVCYMILRLAFQQCDTNATYPILFVVKYLEFLCIFIIAANLLSKTDRVPFLMIDITFLCLSVFQLYSYFILDTWYRIGLPFKTGEVSPNPAGFVLTLFLLIYMYELINGRLKVSQKVVALIGFVSLLLTFSRTNTILFAIISVLMLLASKKKKVTLLKKIKYFGIFAILSVLSNNILNMIIGNRIKYGMSFVAYIINPSNILADGSLQLRMATFKYMFDCWTGSVSSIFFGNGIGFIEVADNLVFSLLVNMGLLGLVLFLFAWYFGILSSFPGIKLIKYVLLFTLLNGLTVETLLVS